MTQFQIIISNNENVLQLQNKLQTIKKSSSFTHHNYKCSMCPPPAARTSTRKPNSSQTRLRVFSVTDFTAAVILFVTSSKSAGNGGTKTRSFTYPRKKKSHGVMSGDLGNQECSAKSLGSVRPIQR